jgi:Ino eighty subunit 2
MQMETINKLLKKQAPKTKGKGLNAGDDPSGDGNRPNAIFVRWVSNKDGTRVAVTEEILSGPVGRVFVPGGLKTGKMVQEVP